MKTGDVASFQNRYGEMQVIHRTRHGLSVKQNPSLILKMNQAVSGLIGQKIRAAREERGWTLVELATRTGMHSGHPKNRMWEIENSIRGQGLRMGTVYALALALGAEATDLMPSVEEVAELAGAELAQLRQVSG